MLELIVRAAVPAAVMRSAAAGTLSLPAEEMRAILEHLSTIPEYAEQAKQTLARLGPRGTTVDLTDEPEVAQFIAENREAIAIEKAAPIEYKEDDEETTAEETLVASTAAAKKQLSPEKLSTLQKLNKMNVAQRIKAAMLGSSEERNILIRDGSRLVYSAVLSSPKLAVNEVEGMAALKNVQQGVLREIARNRKFLKNYNVVKNLVNNPRCPLDLSLPLMKSLLVPDLKGLSNNKNVPENVRKLALKAFKDKSAPAGKKSE